MSNPNRSDWPPHVRNLIGNIEDVLSLLNLHSLLTGSGPGRRYGVEVLNKSGLVLVIACWEAFVEDLCETAFDFLVSESTSPARIPNRVLVAASKPLRETDDEREVWNLAGDGWKQVLLTHRDQIIDKSIGRLNTPRPANVDALVENLVGFKTLSSTWRWQGKTAENVKSRLDELVTTRGAIAHRVSAEKYVRKKEVIEAAILIQRCAVRSSNEIREHLLAVVGNEPWEQLRFGGVA